jgi:DNA primase
VSELDYRAIRGRIPIHHVLELLHYRPAVLRGPQWRGACPICSRGDEAAADLRFSINVVRSLFHCFRCQRGGNQLDLWVEVSGLPLRRAALDLCNRLGIDPAEFTKPQPPNRP